MLNRAHVAQLNNLDDMQRSILFLSHSFKHEGLE